MSGTAKKGKEQKLFPFFLRCVYSSTPTMTEVALTTA